jgi:hypothetical protein
MQEEQIINEVGDVPDVSIEKKPKKKISANAQLKLDRMLEKRTIAANTRIKKQAEYIIARDAREAGYAEEIEKRRIKKEHIDKEMLEELEKPKSAKKKKEIVELSSESEEEEIIIKKTKPQKKKQIIVRYESESEEEEEEEYQCPPTPAPRHLKTQQNRKSIIQNYNLKQSAKDFFC